MQPVRSATSYCNAAGEIWLVGLDLAVGHEQLRTRLVVIVSPAPFNALTRTTVVLPVTIGGRFAHRRGLAVSLHGSGSRTSGLIRRDQPRALDLATRNGSRLETVSEPIMDDVLARRVAILSQAPLPVGMMRKRWMRSWVSACAGQEDS